MVYVSTHVWHTMSYFKNYSLPKLTDKRWKEITDLSRLEYSDVITLLSNSENREHLKNFRDVDCVLANRNKVKDTQVNLKTTN